MNEEMLFIEALEIRDPAERAAFLDRACAGDAAVRGRLERLLDQHEKAGSFLDRPAAALRATGVFDPATGDETASVAPRECAGTLIGPYKLLQQIGEGGMGTVYMAEQTQPVQRKVALKVIKPGMDSRQVIARFEAERQALAMMDHVNIARVLDAGTTESGRPYFVMELVHGVPITKYCDDNHLTPRERLELFVPVCQAIQHAHQKGIIHRDIKPSNVMITLYDGKPVPKVIDFGVAKATEQKLTERTLFTQYGTMVGTLEYMSPEQAEMSALGVDTRSDIYSLGVLLYELLTGSTPLSHKRMKEAAYAEILRMIKEEEPPKPSTRLSDSGEALASISAQRHMEPAKLTKLMRGELDWIVMKCLEKDRDERYASAINLSADIRCWLEGEPLSVRAASLPSMLRVWLRYNFGSTGWAFALGVTWGIVGGAVAWLVMLNALDLSLGMRRAIYLLGAAFVGSGGLMTVWLVRPRNTAADVASGAITGVVSAVISYTLSWGWVAVSIAGVPYGIWLGMLSALVFMGSICIIETMAAGMLLRRHGQVHSTIGPYAELIVPSFLAVVFSSSALFRLATVGLGERFWHPIMVPPLVLAVISVLTRWPWRIRALLHAAWLVSLCAFVIM